MVVNESPDARDVQITLDGLATDQARDGAHATARWECIYLNELVNQLVRARSQGRRFSMPPYSTYAVRFDLPANWKPDKQRERIELFGNSVMNEFTDRHREVEVAVDIPRELLATDNAARIRVGLLGSQQNDRSGLVPE